MDWHRVLGVRPDARRNEIERAYRRLVQVFEAAYREGVRHADAAAARRRSNAMGAPLNMRDVRHNRDVAARAYVRNAKHGEYSIRPRPSTLRNAGAGVRAINATVHRLNAAGARTGVPFKTTLYQLPGRGLMLPNPGGELLEPLRLHAR